MKSKVIILVLLICSLAFAQNKPYRLLNSFSAGELSELLKAREDLSKYHSGCSVMENMFPLPQGAAQKRPGTVYVAESKNNTVIRLLPFEYSTTQSYIIELGNQYARFFTDQAAINTGNGTETIPTGNIVAHWLLNEVVGTDVADDDGNTHDGVATVDAVTLTETGKVGTGCFDLDGQYAVAMTDHGDFSFDDSGSNPFSIACWAYVTQGSDIQNLVSKWKEATAREWRFSLTDDRKLQLHLSDDSISISGAVSHYFLNDNAASTAVDDDIELQDGVATANTNTLSATGVISTCLDFGGSAAVEINDNAAYSFGDGSDDSAFSISAWIYVKAGTTQQTILGKFDYTSSAVKDIEWRLYLESNESIYFSLYDNSETNAYEMVMTDDSLTNGWHHVVATYDGNEDNDGMLIYIDGSTVGIGKSSWGTYTAMEDGATKMTIGARYTAGSLSSYFEDKIDNVILFNVELTASNITSLWNSGNGTETLSATFPSAISDDAVEIGWHYFVSTYTGAGGATAANGIILYVDGAAVDSTKTNEASYVAMENTATTPKIGCQESAAAANEKFWGDKIDEVTVYSDVLTAAEIATLYGETPYEIETPYLTADLFELKMEQSADILYITHPDYETQKLSRLANATWSLDVYGAEAGPFRDQNTDVADFITASATTGSVTLTATGCTPFVTGTTAGHEPSGAAATSKSQTGALFKIIHPIETLEYSEQLTDNYTNSQVENTSWMDCGTVYEGTTWYLVTLGTWTGVLEIQRNYTIGAAHGASGWETVLPYAGTDDRNVDTYATETAGNASYRAIFTETGDAAESCYVYFRTNATEHTGIVEITSVASPTSAIGTVLTTLASTTATHRWSEGAWSNYRGWPRTVTFFEDRLTFGGNVSQPDTIWASVTGDYGNMLAGSNDDDALLFTLSSREVNIINWLIGKDKILIGTSGAEWTLGGESDEALTPSNVKAEQHSTYGSADLQATQASESVLFFQRGAEKMRELAYNWELDAYVAPDMTILVPEVTGDGITDTAFQQTPNPILWCVKENGDMAVFVYERKEMITSWSRLITDDDFESVAIIHGDPEDEVWVSAKRTIGGVDQRYIEYFSARDWGSDPCDAFYVDSGITYDSTATTTITGLTHLEGETVSVLGDGAVLGSEVVSGGSITIDSSCSTVQAGLPYTVQMKTMPLSWIAQGMTIQGRIKRINEVVVSYFDSGDFYIGRDVDTKELVSITSVVTSEQRKTFPPGYDRPGYVFIYQQSPEPLTLIALMVEFQIY